ncbi:MAG: hypothetical protein RLZZ414_100 [Bacteroidota bacterium]|jgi:hypothetical protein
MIEWDKSILEFIELCNKYNVKMLLIGGGAVNFYGYQRHSADLDFWISTDDNNLQNLISVLQKLGYDINEFPNEIQEQKQNISLKFSPTSLNIELITKFDVNKSFEEAFIIGKDSFYKGFPQSRYKVIDYNDLILSKIKASRPKDLLDIQELERLKEKKS